MERVVNYIKAFFRVMFGMPTADDLLKKSHDALSNRKHRREVVQDLVWMAKCGRTEIAFSKFAEQGKYEFIKNNIPYLESLGYSVRHYECDASYSVSWENPNYGKKVAK